MVAMLSVLRHELESHDHEVQQGEKFRHIEGNSCAKIVESKHHSTAEENHDCQDMLKYVEKLSEFVRLEMM